MQNTSQFYFFKLRMKSKFIWCVHAFLFFIMTESFSQQSFYGNFNHLVSPLYHHASGDFSITGDGIIVGVQSVNSDSGIMVFKINYPATPGFKILLNRNFGTNFYPLQIQQLLCTSDSLITILGHDNGFPVIIKLSQTGVLISAKRFVQGDVLMFSLQEIDGFLYSLGACDNPEQSGCIIKMDLIGNIIGTFAINNNLSGRVLAFFEMVKAPDGGFFIAGEHSFPNQVLVDKLVLMKTDSSFNVQWQKHFTTDSVFSNIDMTPAGLHVVPGGGVMIVVNSAANCCSKIMVTDSVGNITAYHEYELTAGFNNAYFHELYVLSNGNFLTGGVIGSNALSAAFPCSVELDAAGDLVNYIAYPSDSAFGHFIATATAYKEGQGLMILGDQQTAIGKNRIVVYDTDSLLELDCMDPALAISKVQYSAHDSIFTFNIIQITRTNINFTNSINIATPSLNEEYKCVPVGLFESPLEENNFEIYPNPANSELMVLLNEIHDSNSSTIRMYSSTGKLILENSVTNEKTSVDVSYLPAGFYYIQLKATRGVSTKKVILVK